MMLIVMRNAMLIVIRDEIWNEMLIVMHNGNLKWMPIVTRCYTTCTRKGGFARE